MVAEYMHHLYIPAHRGYSEVRRSSFELARERSRWNAEVQNVWDNVKFLELGPGPQASLWSGSAIPMRAVVDLGGLAPDDVRVEAIVGRVGSTGQLEDTEIVTLPAAEQRGAAFVFEREFIPHQTGRLGYAFRVSPNHDDNPLTRPCNSLIKWGLE
jgi:starch phosphorylase